ncbi:MAG: tilS [Gemmataceae bacterium]|nr:tilS [Gemmataceae bacterium]
MRYTLVKPRAGGGYGELYQGRGMRTPRVVQVIRRFMAARPGGQDPGVVAVSGGADSVALLRALAAVPAGPLTVAHVNHLLRGAESDADEAFVRDLAGVLGVGFRAVRVDVGREAAGANLEGTARRVRYARLAEVAGEVGARWVATGHTADDQAETVLHRLIRGTGLQGLRGIGSSHEWRAGGMSPPGSSLTDRAGEGSHGGLMPPARLFRPFLTVTRAEIVEYLTSLGQPFREDASNADPRFTRNRIRADLLPLLKTFNPEVMTVLGRLAEQAAEAHAVIAEQARALLDRAELPRAGKSVILDAGILTAAPQLVLRAALRLIWEREGWPMGEMGYFQWERAVDVAQHLSGGWDFPGGVSARYRGRVVQIGRAL